MMPTTNNVNDSENKNLALLKVLNDPSCQYNFAQKGALELLNQLKTLAEPESGASEEEMNAYLSMLNNSLEKTERYDKTIQKSAQYGTKTAGLIATLALYFSITKLVVDAECHEPNDLIAFWFLNGVSLVGLPLTCSNMVSEGVGASMVFFFGVLTVGIPFAFADHCDNLLYLMLSPGPAILMAILTVGVSAALATESALKLSKALAARLAFEIPTLEAEDNELQLLSMEEQADESTALLSSPKA